MPLLDSPYFPVILAFLLNLALSLVISSVALAVGPKKPSLVKSDIYECGIPVRNDSRVRFSVKFYLTAILFILFDIEALFLYLWATAFDALGWFGLVEVLIFILFLVAGYVYVLKRGALRWE